MHLPYLGWRESAQFGGTKFHGHCEFLGRLTNIPRQLFDFWGKFPPVTLSFYCCYSVEIEEIL